MTKKSYKVISRQRQASSQNNSSRRQHNPHQSYRELPSGVHRIVEAAILALEDFHRVLIDVRGDGGDQPRSDRLTFFLKNTDVSRRQLVAALNEWNDKAHTLACDELSARFARAFEEWSETAIFLGRQVGRQEEASFAVKGCFGDLRESAVVS